MPYRRSPRYLQRIALRQRAMREGKARARMEREHVAPWEPPELRRRLIVECYGKAWSTYFGAIGSATLRGFLAGCHPDYVATRMAPKGSSYLQEVTTAVLSALRSNG